jgi:peptidyl-dipeptidase A
MAALEKRRAKVYSERGAFEKLRRWREAPPRGEVEARALEVTYLAFLQERKDPALVKRLVDLAVEVQAEYTNFRASFRGGEVADNEIDRILHESKDLGERRDAWEASKQIGARVHARVRELARLRNANARAAGFPDHYRMALAAQELTPEELWRILDDLERRTEAPWRETKARIDAEQCAKLGVPMRSLPALPPWLYADPFFQKVPPSADLNLDALFKESDLVRLALDTYDGLGMEVRDILKRSSLEPATGKCQHAFCTNIDRARDIRILCNLVPSARWMETLLHELGHAVYDKYLDARLPWALRTPAHTLTTEAIALLMGRQVQSRDWLRLVRRLPEDEVARLTALVAEDRRRALLVFARWALVMCRFERALYEDPERDLDALWWELVGRIQGVPKPERRSAPDWAAKIHIACSPVYYHNYLLGDLMASQLERSLPGGRLIGSRKAGAWLRKKVFAPGSRWPWYELIRRATGKALTAEAWVEEVCG